MTTYVFKSSLTCSTTLICSATKTILPVTINGTSNLTCKSTMTINRTGYISVFMGSLGVNWQPNTTYSFVISDGFVNDISGQGNVQQTFTYTTNDRPEFLSANGIYTQNKLALVSRVLLKANTGTAQVKLYGKPIGSSDNPSLVYTWNTGDATYSGNQCLLPYPSHTINENEIYTVVIDSAFSKDYDGFTTKSANALTFTSPSGPQFLSVYGAYSERILTLTTSEQIWGFDTNASIRLYGRPVGSNATPSLVYTWHFNDATVNPYTIFANGLGNVPALGTGVDLYFPYGLIFQNTEYSFVIDSHFGQAADGFGNAYNDSIKFTTSLPNQLMGTVPSNGTQNVKLNTVLQLNYNYGIKINQTGFVMVLQGSDGSSVEIPNNQVTINASPDGINNMGTAYVNLAGKLQLDVTYTLFVPDGFFLTSARMPGILESGIDNLSMRGYTLSNLFSTNPISATANLQSIFSTIITGKVLIPPPKTFSATLSSTSTVVAVGNRIRLKTITATLSSVSTLTADVGKIIYVTLNNTISDLNIYGSAASDYFGSAIAITPTDELVVGSSGEATTYGGLVNVWYNFNTNPNSYQTITNGSYNQFGLIAAASNSSTGAYYAVGGYANRQITIYTSGTSTVFRTLSASVIGGAIAGASSTFPIGIQMDNTQIMMSDPVPTTAGYSNKARVYVVDIATGALVYTLTGPTETGNSLSTYGRNSWSMAITPSYYVVSQAASFYTNGTGYLYIYNRSNGTLKQTIALANNSYNISQVAANDSMVIYATTNPSTNLWNLKIYDPNTGNLLTTINYVNDGNSRTFGAQVAISPNGRYIAVLSVPTALQPSVYIYDASTYALLQTYAFGSNGTGNESYRMTISDRYIVIADPNNSALGSQSGRLWILKMYQVG